MTDSPLGQANSESLGPQPAAPQGGGDPAGTDLMLKVLGVVGAGIGILGFVTFVGGAIIWTRADEAKLPATEAVSVVPNAVLIATGATHLVSAVLIALLAVGLIFVVHIWNRLRGERRVLAERQRAKELSQEAERLEREAAAAAQPAEAAHALAGTLQEAVVQGRETQGPVVDLSTLEEQANAQLLASEELAKAAVKATTAAAEKRVEAENKQASVEATVERSEREYQAELVVGIVILAIVPTWVKGAIFHVPFVPYGLGLILAAILVPAISLFTYIRTDKFLWFGVAAFVTVGLYIGFSSYFSTKGNPKMQPVAALRTGHAPVTGVFVADTGKDLYVGSFAEHGKPARLVVIPRSQLTELVIGPLLEPGLAKRRSIHMALDQCSQNIEAVSGSVEAAADGEEKVTRACSEAQRKELAAVTDQLDQPG